MRDAWDVLEARLWNRCIPEPNTGCWLWLGAPTSGGYGQIKIGGNAGHFTAPHIVSWEVQNKRRVPEGLCVCHKCDVKLCINPRHLFVGTHQENMDDMIRKGRKRVARGEDAGGAKLRAADVLEIRRRYTHATKKLIAAEFGVSHQLVYRIHRRTVWRHLAEES